MKRFIYIILATAFLMPMSACRDEITQIFVANSPIYMSYETLASSVKQTEAQAIENPGKIYFKDNYLFVVEERKGIHIIDNTDPANPLNKTFVEVPGVVDIAIKDNVMYVDSYVDLVAISLADLDSIVEVERVPKVFPYTLPPYNEDYPLANIDQDQGVVIDWEIKTVRQVVEQIDYPVYYMLENTMNADMGASYSSGISGSGFGVGGSMARFGMLNNTLYAVGDYNLYIFNISNADLPVYVRDYYAGWSIETLFVIDDKLFMGTSDGVRIFDASSPENPQYLSSFWHVTGCDPVVVAGTLAYVTLRGGNACGGTVNSLDVLNVSDLMDPSLVKSYTMEGPYGLGIEGNTLFLCDGDAGLKVFDVSDPLTIDEHLIAVFPDIFAYDVIPYNGLLFLIGSDGFYQYDYQNLQDIQLVSKIEVSQK